MNFVSVSRSPLFTSFSHSLMSCPGLVLGKATWGEPSHYCARFGVADVKIDWVFTFAFAAYYFVRLPNLRGGNLLYCNR